MDIDNIVTKLYERMQHEIGILLEQQNEKLGITTEKFKNGLMSIQHPYDERRLATYYYLDRPILTVQASENFMGVEFVPHKIESRGGSQ
jgi:hypothetical protein